MKLRVFLPTLAVLALAFSSSAQDPGPPPNPGQDSGAGNTGGYGQRGGRGGMMGRGLMGVVTEVAADRYTIKTETGDVYTVLFTANTRIFKQPSGARGPGGEGGGQGAGGGYGRGDRGNPPQEIKATDIKVGDSLRVMGEIDTTAKSVTAMRIVQLDPEAAKRMQQEAASFGKTWLQGKVTAIDGATLTLTGMLDNAAHTVVADENTTFRRRRDPVTLADIHVGDTIRVEGAMKNGVFAATTVNLGGSAGGPGGPPPDGQAGPPPDAPPGPPPSGGPQQ
jgi:hypothetical protein